MAKKQKKFKDWDDEWDDNPMLKRDGKRYNVKKQEVKMQRKQRFDQKDSFFNEDD